MDAVPREPDETSVAPRLTGSVLLGCAVTLILSVFAAGDVGWYDGGELSAAFAGLGVGHPTGFPLFSVLGYIVSLIPVGSVSFRLALLSAASVGLATGCCHGIARAAGCRSWTAAIGALIFPAIFVVWLHGTRVEVYGPNVGLLALVAWTLLRPRPLWRSAGLLSGLGLGAHATFPLTAVGLWLLVLARERKPRMLLHALPWVLLGGMIIVYLPVAAGRGPWVNWGDPSDLASLWRHLTAQGIRESFADEMGAGGVAALNAARAWATLVSGGGGIWLIVPLLVALLVRSERWIAAAVIWVIGADAVFSIWLNPMGQADLQTGVPGAWGLSLGLALVVGATGGPMWSQRLMPWFTAALVAWVGAQRWDDRTPDTLAGSWGRLALGESPPGSLVLASTDHLASLSLYLQGVERFRPDVLVLVKQHLPDTGAVTHRYGWHGTPPPSAYTDLSPDQQLERLDAIVRSELPERPVIWELGDGRFDGRVSHFIAPRGQLYQVRTEPGVSWKDDGASQQTALKKLVGSEEPGFRSRRVFSELRRLRATWHMLRDEFSEGAVSGEQGLVWDPSSPSALVTLAAARRRQGDNQEAIRLLYEALRLDPLHRRAAQNLEAYGCTAEGGCEGNTPPEP